MRHQKRCASGNALPGDLWVRIQSTLNTKTSLYLVALLLMTLGRPGWADSPWIYGIHWWGHWEGQPIDATPGQLFNCPTYGGWTVETIITHSDYHWTAPFFLPLYQELYTNKNMSIITRIDYEWGETVPSLSEPYYSGWADSCVDVVNTLGPYCHIWQIGNEANVMSEARNWPENRIYPAQYAQVYRDVRNAIHASANGSPAGEHIVCIAAPSPGGAGGLRWMSGADWLGQVLDAIPDDEIDGVGIHSYGGSISGFHESYSTLLAELTTRGLHDVPVYMTEWNRPGVIGDAASEAASAQFCRDSFADVHHWNQTPGNHNIVCLAWFVYDANQQAGEYWGRYAIEHWRTDGNPLGDPGDLFTAFQHAVAQHYPAGAVGNPGYTGGRPISPGAVAITADSGGEPDLSIDRTLQTQWTSADTAGVHWLQLDLGLRAPLTGIAVYHAGAGGAPTAQNTVAFTVESAPSLAGPWTTEFVGDNAPQDNVSTYKYATPKPIRHLRLYITDPGSDNRARICEFEVRSEEIISVAMPIGENVATSSLQASASSEFSPAFRADKAIDGIISEASKWTSSDVTPPHTLTLDLGVFRPVSGFVLRHASAAGEASHFNATSFSFQSARSWTGPWFTESVGTNDGSKDFDARRFVSPKDLRYIRLHIADPGIDNLARIPEFEVWAATGLVAKFTADQTTGHAPLTVKFTDLTFGDPTTWNWDFGDGSDSSTEQHPSRTYTRPGFYTVTLTTSDTSDSDSETKIHYIEVLTIGADFDADGDVDQEDFGHFQACFSGAGIAQGESDCEDARLDDDDDVDADDFGIFQACMSGANIPADPNCAD